MDHPRRFCTACGTPLEFTSDHYQCLRCGKITTVGQTLNAAPPVPQFRAGGMSPGPSGWYGPWPFRSGAFDPLHREKLAYLVILLVFGVGVVASFVLLFSMGTAAMRSLSPAGGAPDVSDLTNHAAGIWAFLGPLLIVQIIAAVVVCLAALVLHAVVLFRRETWLKWVFITLAALSLPRFIVALVIQGSSPYVAILFLGGLLALLLEFWFGYILYRDVVNERRRSWPGGS